MMLLKCLDNKILCNVYDTVNKSTWFFKSAYFKMCTESFTKNSVNLLHPHTPLVQVPSQPPAPKQSPEPSHCGMSSENQRVLSTMQIAA